ncbi:MAG TPA: hypothetical protein VGQ83_11750, partial [Polyangia bacterium]
QIVANGVVVATRPVTAADAVAGTAIKLDATFPLAVDGDTWIVVVAKGDSDLGPVCPGARPAAVTSPIFIDADGDGAYTGPLQAP